jgi:hypothetical protein
LTDHSPQLTPLSANSNHHRCLSGGQRTVDRRRAAPRPNTNIECLGANARKKLTAEPAPRDDDSKAVPGPVDALRGV